MNVQDVPIARPCPARWDRMAGTDQARFCRECRQTVYDLSAMTEDQARAFAAANPDACRRYTYDGRTGAILHRQAACGTARVRIASRKAGVLAAISLALAGPAQASVSVDLDGSWVAWVRDQVEAYATSVAVWAGLVDPPAPPLPVITVAPPPPDPPPEHLRQLGGAPRPAEHLTTGGKPVSVRHQ